MRNRKTEKKAVRKGFAKTRAAIRSCVNRYNRAYQFPRYGKNVFLQLFVDAATGHMQGFLMKRSAEAAHNIRKGIWRLELAVGKTFKRYHLDNAKEQWTIKLLTGL